MMTDVNPVEETLHPATERYIQELNHRILLAKWHNHILEYLDRLADPLREIGHTVDIDYFQYFGVENSGPRMIISLPDHGYIAEMEKLLEYIKQVAWVTDLRPMYDHIKRRTCYFCMISQKQHYFHLIILREISS